MNRKDFFKKLVIGLGSVIILPEILADIKIRKISKNEEYYRKLRADEHGPWTLKREKPLYMSNKVSYPFINDAVYYDNKLWLIVFIIDSSITLRPLAEGEDIAISLEEYYRHCVNEGNLFLEKTI